jgi:hypothetical protein
MGVRDLEQHGSASLRRRNVCHMSPALKQCKGVCNKRTPRLKGDEEERNEFILLCTTNRNSAHNQNFVSEEMREGGVWKIHLTIHCPL